MTDEATTTVRVEATGYGIYDWVPKKPGDVFDLVKLSERVTERVLDADGEPALTKGTGRPITRKVDQMLTAEEQFDPKWMRRVPPDTPVTPRFADALPKGPQYPFFTMSFDDHDLEFLEGSMFTPSIVGTPLTLVARVEAVRASSNQWPGDPKRQDVLFQITTAWLEPEAALEQIEDALQMEVSA